VATIRSIERQIYRIEGFRVRILHGRDGRDVRGDKGGVPGFTYARAMKNDANVVQWRRQRFDRKYPGYKVEVLRADGLAAHGGTLLGTLRRAYLDA
jgi:hypothetical protein